MVSNAETSRSTKSGSNSLQRNAESAERAIDKTNGTSRTTQKSERSEDSKNSSQPVCSSKIRRRRSRSQRAESKLRECSMLSKECPNRVSYESLMRTAAIDRKRREHATFVQMIRGFGMTEAMLRKAVERQNANISMRGLALYLEVMCVAALGIMGILAQHYFNTRGNLNYYLGQMTFELFLFLMVILNITTWNLWTRTASIGVFVLAICVNLFHILMDVRSKGTFFRCDAREIVLQHCFLKLIPTHYHARYMSSFLLVLHLALVLISVSMVIFYDGSLEWYLDHTPGSQQWITSQPLHRHDGVDEEDAQAKVFKGTRQKTDISAEFSFKDLPVGTSIIREQTEYTVQQTTIDSSGKKSVGPEEVTMSRSYTLDIPGVDRVTGIRRWRKSPQQAGTPSTSTKAVANADKTNSIEAKSTGKAIEAVSELTLTKRNPAGKDSDLETPTADISRMPPLISRIAYLKNKNLMESDGKT